MEDGIAWFTDTFIGRTLRVSLAAFDAGHEETGVYGVAAQAAGSIGD
jgi:hypothetical protein